MSDLWDELPWELCGPPLVPTANEIARYVAFSEQYPTGVLLGATPSIAAAVQNVVPLDLAPGRVASCQRALVADWRILLQQGFWTEFVIGDGILGSMSGTDPREFIRALQERHIHGLLRCYTRDSYRDPDNHNEAKIQAWRLAADEHGMFSLQGAWNAAMNRGWLDTPEAKRAFAPYEHSREKFWLASRAELQSLGTVTDAEHTGCVWLTW